MLSTAQLWTIGHRVVRAEAALYPAHVCHAALTVAPPLWVIVREADQTTVGRTGDQVDTFPAFFFATAALAFASFAAIAFATYPALTAALTTVTLVRMPLPL